MKFLMICLGNICRSPLAEGILKEKIKAANLPWEVDSAGTSGWHDGNPPDPRSIEIADKYGTDISDQVSRKVRSIDIDDFDRILVMDEQNLQDVLRYCHTDEERAKVKKIMSYLPDPPKIDVPDPYYGTFGFDEVYQMLDEACTRLIEVEKEAESSYI